MKNILVLWCLVFLSMNVFANTEGKKIEQNTIINNIDQSDPYKMINEVSKVTFKRFSDEHADIKESPNLLKTIVAEELIPYIDYRYAALKVLGKHLRKQDRADVNEFIPVFRDYLITEYAQVFTLYDQQKVNFEPAKTLGDERIVPVAVEVMQPGGNSISIVFQVRRGKNQSKWKAFNMIAEGVSMLDSKQAEFSGLIGQKGLPYVTKLLKEKSERDIYFK